MFRCDSCGNSTKPGEPMTRRVVETRRKVYDNGDIGTETVREQKWCPDCAKGARS